MNRDGVYGGLVFLLLIMTSVEGGGDVSFWRTTVTLTCPDKGDWYDNTIKMNEEESKEIKMDYDESKKNVYQCKYLYDQYDTEKTTYQFYFKGKATSRSAGRGPPVVPSPDYEPLSVATRSSDIYATTQTSTQRTG
ncbi:T-cell surface glycoprotein CD3 epsilon chain isoform 2 precursor [Salmo salar]|uniref:CD3 epsilon n=1 Tax=Salmo salar TaxID=8030 RepID=D2K6A7_SALSA|nr:T-cell surface glycoprotein CD3 epsilon chain isoform 2 precursor [Salmo salar]ACZ57825.1 CD3 epsilon [Salmo salar]|eukprot:NP_001165318.1 T-cell surface glycoprotein CD3 epsilon chain isoform 2 precursor [Salmo salar]